MSDERRQQLNRELNDRMARVVADFAREHNLSEEEVLEIVHSLLLPQPGTP